MDYCLLKDSNIEEANEFVKQLEYCSNSKWKIIHCKDFGKKSIIHYIKMIFFPLCVFLKRNTIKKVILSWQQYYGIVFAFYCRLFKVRKKVKLVIMTFIYAEKKGLIGKIKHKFIKYSINSKYVDKLIVTTLKEVDYYKKIFNNNKFVYVSWAINPVKINISKGNYIFSTGRSNRDYDFLIDSVSKSKFDLYIACDSYMKTSTFNNVVIDKNLHGLQMLEKMANSFCVAIKLKDSKIASGQLVLLQAISMGKPILIERNSSLSEYVLGDSGVIMYDNKTEFLNALNLLNCKTFYKECSVKEKKFFYENYSIQNMAKKIFSIINEC